MNTPLLSICIPTYNRSSYLENTLMSIVRQKCFTDTDSVEIVISDNCSSDNTQGIGEKYMQLYEGKVKYFRNVENIKDANFEKVLSYGTGIFLKLNNDTLTHLDGSLDAMLETISNAKDSKIIPFFPNGVAGIGNTITDGINDFINVASFWITSIGCFGIWKSDFDLIDDFSLNSKLQLTQVEVLLKIVAERKLVLIDNRSIFLNVEPTKKGGYNFYQVFVCNYFAILEKYLSDGSLTLKTYNFERRKFLKNYLLPWTIKFIFESDKFCFSNKGAFGIVIGKFWDLPYFYISILKFVRKVISELLKKGKRGLIDKIKFS